MAISSIKQELLTAERLRELLHYNPDTGIFTRLVGSRKFKVGSPSGWINAYGYRYITIDYRSYPAHRIAWLYSFGKWPSGVIDHININPSDNRLCNLRDVSVSENLCNQKQAYSNNKSGFLGVSFDQRCGRFFSRIHKLGTVTHLGLYDTAELASEAYVKAKKTHHPFAIVDK